MTLRPRAGGCRRATRRLLLPQRDSVPSARSPFLYGEQAMLGLPFLIGTLAAIAGQELLVIVRRPGELFQVVIGGSPQKVCGGRFRLKAGAHVEVSLRG